MLQLLGQAIKALVGSHFQIVGSNTCPGEDLVQRLAMLDAVLTDIESQHVQAEDIDTADQVMNESRRAGLSSGLAQVGGQRIQVFEQFLAVAVDSRRGLNVL